MWLRNSHSIYLVVVYKLKRTIWLYVNYISLFKKEQSIQILTASSIYISFASISLIKISYPFMVTVTEAEISKVTIPSPKIFKNYFK